MTPDTGEVRDVTAEVSDGVERPVKVSSRRKALSIVSGLLVSALFLWLALREVDLAVLRDNLSRAAWWPLAPFALALMVYFALKAMRWRLLLRDEHGVSTARLVNPMMMGFAANNVFPLRAGELIRAYTAGRSLGIPMSEVIASLFIERALDALSVAALVSIAVVLWQLGHGSDAQVTGLLWAAMLLMILAAGGLLLVGFYGNALPRLAKLLPLRWQARVSTLLTQFANGLEPLARSTRRRALGVLSTSLFQWFLIGVCTLLSMLAVGVNQGPWIDQLATAIIVLGVVVVGTSAPSGPAYVGAIEYAFVLGLGFFDVPPTDALAAGIYYHCVFFIVVTSSGAVCWLRHAQASSAASVSSRK